MEDSLHFPYKSLLMSVPNEYKTQRVVGT